jgi:hypothetical protein
VLAARRAVDQQNGWCAAPQVAALRLGYRCASRQPVDRKIIVRIGKFVARLARPRSFATVLVGVPGRGRDLVELGGERIERGILELTEKTPTEFAFVQARAGHSLAGVNCGIGPLLVWPWRSAVSYRPGTNASGPSKVASDRNGLATLGTSARSRRPVADRPARRASSGAWPG